MNLAVAAPHGVDPLLYLQWQAERLRRRGSYEQQLEDEGMPAELPPALKLEAHGEAQNGWRQLAAQAHIADAYDTVMRRYFWETWPEETEGRLGRVKHSPWDRAVVWRRLETGDSHAELGVHFGVGADVVKRVLKRHEVAAGWRGKKR